MATKKQQEKKKKQRERKAHARVVARREALRASRKADRDQQLQEAAAYEIVHGKQRPFIKDADVIAALDAAKSKAVAARLRKNLEILQALEEEYEKEQAVRAEVNEKLESEGHKSLKEKMDALHQKALEMTGKAEALADAASEYADHQIKEPELVVQPEQTENNSENT